MYYELVKLRYWIKKDYGTSIDYGQLEDQQVAPFTES